MDSKLNKDLDKFENVEEDFCWNLSLIDGMYCINLVLLESFVIFYGVCFDVNCFLLGCGFIGVLVGRMVVFISKEEVFNVVKKFKGVCFKVFKIRLEVEVFL